MNDDELLKALRETVRAEELAMGGRKPELPVNDAAFLDRMTDLALKELGGAGPRTIATRQTKGESKPRTLLQKTAWVWPMAAAAIALVALLREQAPAPLAQYRVEIVQGSERTTRDPSTVKDSLTLRPGLPFELTLRPASMTEGPLTAEVYLLHAQKLSALPVRVDATPLGVVHVQGKLPEALEASATDGSLLVYVGRPDALPRPKLPGADSETHGSDRFQAFQIEIRARRP